MWKLISEGHAYNKLTGEEIYMELGTDKLVRVRRQDKKVINVFKSISEAGEYIAGLVKKMNVEETDEREAD